MNHQTFQFNYHNTVFFGQYWQPKTTKAVIVIVHGMGEHSGRYQHVAEFFTAHDYGVIAFDHFGHGKTSGKRGHNPSFDAILESIHILVEKAKEVFGTVLPVFLYGHSMGGNAVINYGFKKTHQLTGVIATSPFLQLAFQPPAWKLTLGKLLQKIAPSITLGNELDPNDISRDPVEVKKYIDDPLVHDKISPNFSLTFIDTGKWAIQNAKHFTTPILLAHGTSDKIIDYKGSETFAKHCQQAELKLYEGGYHELHNDYCREEVLQNILDWVNDQIIALTNP